LLVIGSTDLYGLDLQTGKEVWKHDLGGRIISKPLVMKDTMYVGAGVYLYALDSKSGATRWRFKTDGNVEYNPCTDGSAVYFGNGKGQFYRLNADGKEVWKFTTRDAFTSHCAIYKDLVIAGGWDHNFYGWNRNTGDVVWKHDSGVIHYGGPEILGDSLYFATHTDFYKMDAATGKVLVKKKTSYLNDLIIVNNFLWTNEIGLSKRDLDGNVLASVKFKPWQHFRPAFGDGIFVVSGTGNSLYGISPDLKLLWKHSEKGTFWSPGVIHNNVYYTGNRNSYVYALSLAR
jgi:outer membrane protein assembly factor BamB